MNDMFETRHLLTLYLENTNPCPLTPIRYFRMPIGDVIVVDAKPICGFIGFSSPKSVDDRPPDGKVNNDHSVVDEHCGRIPGHTMGYEK